MSEREDRHIPRLCCAIDSDGNRVAVRSVLEARWAYYFTKVGLRWKYEQPALADYGSKYAPDFLIDDVGWVELKPNILRLRESWRKLKRFVEGGGNGGLRVFAICSYPPLVPHAVFEFAGKPARPVPLDFRETAVRLTSEVFKRECAGNEQFFWQRYNAAMHEAERYNPSEGMTVGDTLFGYRFHRPIDKMTGGEFEK